MPKLFTIEGKPACYTRVKDPRNVLGAANDFDNTNGICVDNQMKGYLNQLKWLDRPNQKFDWTELFQPANVLGRSMTLQ